MRHWLNYSAKLRIRRSVRDENIRYWSRMASLHAKKRGACGSYDSTYGSSTRYANAQGVPADHAVPTSVEGAVWDTQGLAIAHM